MSNKEPNSPIQTMILSVDAHKDQNLLPKSPRGHDGYSIQQSSLHVVGDPVCLLSSFTYNGQDNVQLFRRCFGAKGIHLVPSSSPSKNVLFIDLESIVTTFIDQTFYPLLVVGTDLSFSIVRVPQGFSG